MGIRNFIFSPDGNFVIKIGGMANAKDGKHLDKMKSYVLYESYN